MDGHDDDMTAEVPEIGVPLEANRSTNDDLWRRTIEKVIPAIVCIEFMTLKSFDTFTAGSSKATGFVVDHQRGIILTNR